MIKSAGQVSPHVHVCFGTWVAPLTSVNSWKFSIKSCLLLRESAREPLSLPNQGVLMSQLGWSPAQHCQVPRLGRANADTHLPQAGKHGMGSITAPYCTLTLLAPQAISGVASFPQWIPCSWNYLTLWSSQLLQNVNFQLSRWDIQRSKSMTRYCSRLYTLAVISKHHSNAICKVSGIQL